MANMKRESDSVTNPLECSLDETLFLRNEQIALGSTKQSFLMGDGACSVLSPSMNPQFDRRNGIRLHPIGTAWASEKGE